MIRKVRVSTVAAEAAQSQWPAIPSSRAAAYRGRTPDMAQDTRDSLVDRLGPSSIGRSVPNRRHVPTKDLIEIGSVEQPTARDLPRSLLQ